MSPQCCKRNRKHEGEPCPDRTRNEESEEESDGMRNCAAWDVRSRIGQERRKEEPERIAGGACYDEQRN